MSDESESKYLTDLGKRCAERIKQIRKQNLMSQRELARRAGISAPHLVLIESGKRGMTVSTLGKIVAGLGLSLSEFFEVEQPLEDEAPQTKLLYRLVARLRKENEDKLRKFERILNVLDDIVDES